MKTCQSCGKPSTNCGRFRTDDGRTFERLCGGCKVRITLTPERKRRLEAEIVFATAKVFK